MTKYKSYEEFISAAYRSYVNPKDPKNTFINNKQRIGQHMMNCLYAEHPRLYRVVTELSTVDPFYNNSRIPAFLTYIERYWESN